MSTPMATPSPTAPGPGGTVSTPRPGGPNLLANPGLEEGLEPWFTLSTEAPEISDVAHSGQASVRLTLREPAEALGAGNRTLVQDPGPGQFPEVLSGYYRVENWKRGAPKQYLELVVVVFDSPNLTAEFPNHQMRYLLAGAAEEPGEVRNAHFVFLSREEPQQNQWVHFQANVQDDYQQLWEAIPEGYSNLRVMSRVVYEDKAAGEPIEADVYFDDLYLGSAGDDPNQPETS